MAAKEETNNIHCQICGRRGNGLDLLSAKDIASPLLEIIHKKYPRLSGMGYICAEDLARFRTDYIGQAIDDIRNKLKDLEQEIYHRGKKFESQSKTVASEVERNLTVGQRMADRVAEFGGSWKFVIAFLAMIVVWMAINTLMLLRRPFDPYPFILLNLALSCIAALQAPIIMMSQNRQEARDRERSKRDLIINLKAEMEIRNLNSKLDLLLTQQWKRLLEIQLIQTELIDELNNRARQRANEDVPTKMRAGKQPDVPAAAQGNSNQ